MKEGSWRRRTKATLFEEQSNQIYLLAGHTATHQILFCMCIYTATYVYVFNCIYGIYVSILCMKNHSNEKYDTNTCRLRK